MNHDRATDMICVKCGGRECFRIGVVGYVTLHRTGDIGDYEHLEFSDDEDCCCLKCGHEGTIGDFRIEGLDVHIATIYDSGEPKL
jgi:hypothetical protein